MERKNVADWVREYVGDVAYVNDVPDTATLVSLGFDSLDNIEFVMAAEEEFRVEISDEQAEKVLTVGDAIALLSAVAP